MVRQLLILACLLGLNLSVVVCREDHDHRPHFSDFMSHHHRRSTPGEIIPSTEVPVELVSGGPTPKPAVAVKTGGEHVGEPQHGSSYNRITVKSTYDDMQTTRIVSIVVSLVLCVIGLIIIFCCGKKIGRRVITGHIVNRPAGFQQPPYPTQ